jgi:hypothetical protein
MVNPKPKTQNPKLKTKKGAPKERLYLYLFTLQSACLFSDYFKGYIFLNFFVQIYFGGVLAKAFHIAFDRDLLAVDIDALCL